MSKKLKIVLVVSIFLVLAVIGLAYFGRGSDNNETITPDETQTSDDIFAPDTTSYPDETVTPTDSDTAISPDESATISATTSNSVSPSASKTSSISINASVTATKASGATTDQSRYVKINPPTKTITPYPNSGPLDWTRQTYSYVVAPTTEFIKKDFCELTNISDSWSSPIEKTICELARFTNKQIIDPINSLLCNIQAAAISLNYRDNVSSELVNGECKVIDR